MKNKKKLDSKLLEKYMKGFYGYGPDGAHYWFIGIEEGGGKSIESVESRLLTWNKRESKEFEDLEEFQKLIGNGHLFQDNAKIEPTWGKIIRVIMGMKGVKPSKEDVRNHQIHDLVRNDEVRLLELLPLPSRGKEHWDYSKWSDIPYLRTRKEYKREILPIRTSYLKDKIKKEPPSAVIFYSRGKQYKESWHEIADTEFKNVSSKELSWALKDHTYFFIIKHPSHFGVTNKYYYKAGKFIAKKLTKSNDR